MPNASSSKAERSPRKRATIRDIAEAAGVSETTVSLAFQPSSRISQATRERVLSIGDKLSYTPNLSAQNLRTGKSNEIGFLVNDITNPFYARMVQIAEKIAQGRGYQVIFSDSHWDAECEFDAIRNMIHSRVEGVLVCPSEKTNEGFAMLEKYSVPFLVVDTGPEDYDGPLIGNNLYGAGVLAAKHLIEIRCKHVAVLTADWQRRTFSAFKQIEKGFTETLASHGVPASEVPVIHAGLTIDMGKCGFEKLLKQSRDVDGVLCVNDLSAIGVIEAADDHGIRVGQDLAVIGIDDLDVSRTQRISLTTIRQPCERLIDLAVNTLLDSIESLEPCDFRRYLEPEIIVRNTTRRTT